jgi:hypothetical protein
LAVEVQLTRRILVNHARRRNLKRGGGVLHVSLEEAALVGIDADGERPRTSWRWMTRGTRCSVDPGEVQVAEEGSIAN